MTKNLLEHNPNNGRKPVGTFKVYSIWRIVCPCIGKHALHIRRKHVQGQVIDIAVQPFANGF